MTSPILEKFVKTAEEIEGRIEKVEEEISKKTIETAREVSQKVQRFGEQVRSEAQKTFEQFGRFLLPGSVLGLYPDQIRAGGRMGSKIYSPVSDYTNRLRGAGSQKEISLKDAPVSPAVLKKVKAFQDHQEKSPVVPKKNQKKQDHMQGAKAEGDKIGAFVKKEIGGLLASTGGANPRQSIESLTPVKNK